MFGIGATQQAMQPGMVHDMRRHLEQFAPDLQRDMKAAATRLLDGDVHHAERLLTDANELLKQVHRYPTSMGLSFSKREASARASFFAAIPEQLGAAVRAADSSILGAGAETFAHNAGFRELSVGVRGALANDLATAARLIAGAVR